MSNTGRYKRLFEPVQIGQMKIRNRIVMPAMETNYAEADSSVGEQIKEYYAARARGGVGLVITEASPVIAGNAYYRPLAVYDDKFIPGLSQLAKVIQKHGAKAAAQLVDFRTANKRPGDEPLGPSAPGPCGEPYREITVAEIAGSVSAFGRAAQRVKEAGFDGVEIHGAHRYLIERFLSPAANRRKDKYGGPLANRARFLLETLQAVREAVGPAYPVWCRINGEETGFSNGITLEEAQNLAAMLEKAGADAISVSAGDADLAPSRPIFSPPGWAAHLAEGVKHAVNVPVIAVGRLTPDLGKKLLEGGKADLIAIGRALRADPDLTNKAASGKLEDIIPCINCNVCLITFRPDHSRLCAVNAAIGREREYSIIPAKKKKNILVVGGGPAGLEAARVAVFRGHKVTLCEKSGKLGGQLLTAAVPPYKEILSDLTRYLCAQVGKAGVKIKLNQEVSPEIVKDLAPDAVILATGVVPIIPPIPGVDGGNVVLSGDVLAGKVKTGKTVAVIGGGEVGCETAEFLAEKGKKVSIVEMLDTLLAEMEPRQGRQPLLDNLSAKGVAMLTSAKVEEITGEGIVIKEGGRRQVIKAETIVLAVGSKPNIKLFEALRGEAPEIYLAGDCVKPRQIWQAIEEGSQIARQV